MPILPRLGRSLLAAALLCLGAASAAAQTTWMVDTTNDDTTTTSAAAQSNCGAGNSSTCALRDAILAAASGDSIHFSVNGTITLTSTLPAINVNLTIQGPGATLLTISGNNDPSVGSVFTVNSGVAVSIGELTIANGSASYGAGVLNFGTLNIVWAALSNNSATTNGGGVFSTGTLVVFDSTFSGNSANCCAGGAIAIYSGTTTIINSTFNGNSAVGGGAIINNSTMSVNNGTFSGNSATGSGSGGAILNYGTLTADNTIFSANSAGGAGAGIHNISGTVSAAYNLFYNNLNSGATEDDCNGCTSTNSAFGADPKLLPLAYYGGDNVETMGLGPGSAAVCAGSSTYEVGPPGSPLFTGFDERFFPVDPTCPAGKVDAGAVQTNQSVVTTLVDKYDSPADCTSGTGNTCSLRDAMFYGVGDVTFLPSLTSTSSPGTITLDQSETLFMLREIGQANIVGPGANRLTISGGNSFFTSSVFYVQSNAFLGLYGLTITGAYNAGALSYCCGDVDGGGIFNEGTTTVVDCAITGNQTIETTASGGFGGGGILNFFGTLAVIDSTISGNSAPSEIGGGIANIFGTLTVTGSTISGNSAQTGGGIVNTGTLTVTGSTISGNTGTTAIGGIESSGTMTVANSIVAGNMGALGPFGPDVYGAATDGGHNLIGDPTSATGFTNGTNGTLVGTSADPLNPQLSPLQFNGIGAALQTMIPLPGSPAICAGSASLVPPGTTTDERGYPLQPTNGYCPSGSIDMGAVQTNYTGLTFAVQPSGTFIGSTIAPSPAVEIVETNTSTNSTDTVAGVPITLDYSGGPGELTRGAASLTATTGPTTIGGKTVNAAVYSLVPITLGSSFTLSAGAGGAGIPVVSGETLTATSNNFPVLGPPAVTLPKPGSKLNGARVVFQWSGGPLLTLFKFSLGTSGPGSGNVFNSSPSASTLVTVANVPVQGKTLYARLSFLCNGNWYAQDFTYTEAGVGTAPALTTPLPGTPLAGSTVTFSWTKGAATSFQFKLGTTGVGASDVFHVGPTSATSVTVRNIPGGKKIYARLEYLDKGTWHSLDYIYEPSSPIRPLPIWPQPPVGCINGAPGGCAGGIKMSETPAPDDPRPLAGKPTTTPPKR